MRQYAKMLLKGVLGLMAAMIMTGWGQAQAVISPVWQGNAGMTTAKVHREWTEIRPLKMRGRVGTLLLAQKAEPGQEKLKSPPAPDAESQKMRKPAAPAAPAPRMDDKSIGGEQLERAGTKKLGGEVIRNKEE